MSDILTAVSNAVRSRIAGFANQAVAAGASEIRKIAGLVAIDLPRLNKDGLRNCHLIAEIWKFRCHFKVKTFQSQILKR